MAALRPSASAEHPVLAVGHHELTILYSSGYELDGRLQVKWHRRQHFMNSVRLKRVPSRPGISLAAQDRLPIVVWGGGSPFRGEGFYGFHLGCMQLMQSAYGESIERKVVSFRPEPDR